MTDNSNINDNLPPIDEERLSAQLHAALDGMERLGLGICKIVIDLENMRSEILLRQLTREGKKLAVDDFGQKE